MLPLHVVDAKVRGRSDCREVLVHMQDWNIGTNRDRGDQAVDKLANRLALTSTAAIDGRGRVEVDRFGRK